MKRTIKQFFKLEPSIPLWRYCILAVPIALIPSAAILFIASNFYRVVESKISSASEISTALNVLGSVIIAPLLETLLLAGFLKILFRLNSHPLLNATIAAALWGTFHGLVEPIWFWGTIWSLFVFSLAFVTWRKISFQHAFLAAAIPHSLINLMANLVLIIAPQ